MAVCSMWGFQWLANSFCHPSKFKCRQSIHATNWVNCHQVSVPLALRRYHRTIACSSPYWCAIWAWHHLCTGNASKTLGPARLLHQTTAWGLLYSANMDQVWRRIILQTVLPNTAYPSRSAKNSRGVILCEKIVNLCCESCPTLWKFFVIAGLFCKQLLHKHLSIKDFKLAGTADIARSPMSLS